MTSSAEGSYSAAQIVPGRYSVGAQLTGFRTIERSGLVLQVGTTLTINLSLPVGGVEESVTVTGQSPLVDTTTATVGGNVGTAELSELPAMNRNYFAAVALLPGVQFSPSNQMGNDTIVANGQTTQNTNVSVDGGYNADDALGTSSGAQVRTPLEAVQEFQVLTSMYDAEFGRASGAIVNAVSKAGTNQFKGVIFGYTASNALTAKDYFVARNNLTKPTTTKRDWGGVVGGPIVKNKAHFFFSLERQVDNPNRHARLPGAAGIQLLDRRGPHRLEHARALRPSDQQRHTWAVRWLREGAPQWYTIGNRQTLESYQDETDLDQTAVGTLTSVFGNNRVNTVRVARTWEHWWHGNACFRAQGRRRQLKDSSSAKRPREDRRCARRSSATRAARPGEHGVAGTVGLELSDRGRLLMVHPRQEGRPRSEVRCPLQLHRARARLADQRERHVHVQHATCRSTPRTRAPIPSGSRSGWERSTSSSRTTAARCSRRTNGRSARGRP